MLEISRTLLKGILVEVFALRNILKMTEIVVANCFIRENCILTNHEQMPAINYLMVALFQTASSLAK